MKNTARRALCLLLALALALCLLAGCSSSVSPDSQPAASSGSSSGGEAPASGGGRRTHKTQGDAVFAAFTREIFVSSLGSNGLTLNYSLIDPDAFGISRDIPDPLGYYSPETWLEDQQAVREELDWLHGYDRESLSPDMQLTWDVLEYYLLRQNEYAGLELHTEPLGALTGEHTSLPILLAEFRFSCEEDIGLYLSMLEDFPRYFDELALFEEYRAKAGYFMGDEQLDELLQFCRADADAAVGGMLRQSLADRFAGLDWLSPADAAEYTAKSDALIREAVLPAYAALADRLEPLRGSGPDDPGAGKLPRAKDYFTFLMWDQVGLDLSTMPSRSAADAVLDILTQRLDELLALTEQLLEEDPSLEDAYFDWTGPDMTPEEMLADLREKSAAEFPLPREAECVVREVSPALGEYLSPAFYLTPPLDSPEQNVIYINPAQLGSGASLYTTLAHEGYPGHLCQSVIAAEAGLDPVRSLLTWRGYSEGWASYVEFGYAYDWALPDNKPLAQYAAAIDEMSLMMMARIDLLINAVSVGNEKAAAVLLDQYGFNPDAAHEVVQLVAEDPGSYLCYALGEIEFLRLRDKAMKTLGSAFDPVEFHRVLLEGGELPFQLLEARLDAWLAEQAA